jgi:DNA adenine methylase
MNVSIQPETAVPALAARPFLKWAGGKTGLLPEILPRLPAKIKTYYEPFVGGGAVFFALAAEKRFERAVLSDSNVELISAYIALAEDREGVIHLLDQHAKKHSEDYYYKIRALDPQRLDLYERGARAIYLNKTCFNGLYRVNRKGGFNVPFGRYENPPICDAENIRRVSAVLRRKGVRLWRIDFEDVVRGARPGDAVYFDPPYVPASTTANFTAYSAGGFAASDQERLRDVARVLVARGVCVLLSNSDTPFVRKLYQEFRIDEVRARRAINSKGDKRGKVGELLITATAKAAKKGK